MQPKAREEKRKEDEEEEEVNVYFILCKKVRQYKTAV
jgi:hypothetical protein